MFKRAGFNPRRVVLAIGHVRMGEWFGWARLVMFVPSGELAWHLPGYALEWHFDCLFYRLVESEGVMRLPFSRWPRPAHLKVVA